MVLGQLHYLEILHREVNHVLKTIQTDDIILGLEAISQIQTGIIGRHCGDLGDKLLQYLTILEYARFQQSTMVNSLEIGTLFGGSCLTKLMAMRDYGYSGKIVCIDPMAGFYGEEADSITGLPVNADTFYQNLNNFGFSKDCVDLRTVLSSDPEAATGLLDGTFATLMIDGDHTYQGVCDDWEKFRRFVAPGGLVLFDDYSESTWPDITRFVNEVLADLPEEWQVCGQLGTTEIITRKSPPSTEPDRDESFHPVQCLNQGKDRPESINQTVEALFDVLNGVGHGHFLNQHYSQAEKYYRQVLDLEMGFLSKKRLDKVVLELGECLEKQQKIADEIHIYEEALAQRGFTEKQNALLCLRLTNLYIGLGRSEMSYGNYQMAKDWFSCADSLPILTPGMRVNILLNLGQAYEKQGEPLEAEEVYIRGVSLSGLTNLETYRLNFRLGSMALVQKRYQEAESRLDLATSLERVTDLEKVPAWISLGDCYVKQNCGQKAVEIYQRALQVDGLVGGQKFRLFNRLMKLFLKEKRFDEANQSYQNAISIEGIADLDRQKLMDVYKTGTDLIQRK